MLTRTLLAATAALVLTSAAQAQDAAPQTAPETPAASAMDETAFEARACSSLEAAICALKKASKSRAKPSNSG